MTVFVISIIWMVLGFALFLMAELTYKFEERHFNPMWMIFLGPLGIIAWLIAEKLEEK
jgi:uncharacterized membrane protein